MSSEFFTSVIEEEKKRFDITNERLKVAARVVTIAYSKKSLKNGSPYVDYNLPEIRCAYMYRYSTLHSGMVTKYFRKMIKKKELKNKLKGSIKICSLGGGPGTDIIGVFKALAVMPFFHKRVTKVSVLDICNGWHNSFDDIMSGLLQGKMMNVPETFINGQKFQQEFIEADLLTPLTENIVKIISNTDIICMTKFVSAILAKSGSLNALQVVGNLLKPGAIVLFIDNCDVSESIEVVFKQVGFETVLGPLQEKFIRASKSNLEVYGCVPQACAKISVVGWIKTNTNVIYEWPSISSLDFSSCDVKSERDISITSPFPDVSSCDAKSQQDISITSPFSDVSSCDAKSEQDISITSPFPDVISCDAKCEQDISITSPFPDVNDYDEGINKLTSFNYCNKYTQTELGDSKELSEDISTTKSMLNELSTLTEALVDLLQVTKRINAQNNQHTHHCCQCH